MLNKKIEEIVKILTKNNETIATMESCTGGMLVNEITNITGASSILRESYVTYCNEAKIKFGVSKEVIKRYTVYSIQVAEEMAMQAAKQARANWGIGVTGQIGRIDPENPGNPDNEVYYAIYNNGIRQAKKIVIKQDMERSKKKEWIINQLVEDLYKLLM